MKKRLVNLVALPAIAALAAGCATNEAGTQSVSGANVSSSKLEAIAEKERYLEQREKQLAERESRLASGGANMSQQGGAGLGGGDLLPPNAKAGECYARVWVDAKYETEDVQVKVKDESEQISFTEAEYRWIEKQVMVEEASSRLETVPAVYGQETERMLLKGETIRWMTDLTPKAAPASQKLLDAAVAGGIDLDAAAPGMCFHEHFRPAEYRTVTEDVLVSEASSRIETEEAQYEWVEERVMVAEASSRIEEVPAVFRTETEQVLDKPAHTIWKKGTGPVQRIDQATGEIMCLVEVPATYKTVTKQVLVSPATTRTVEIPAKYEMVKVRKLVKAPQQRQIEIPAKYSSVSKQEMVSDAEFVWHEISDNTMKANTRTGAQICLVKEPAKYKTVTRQVVKVPASTREVEIPAVYETVKVKELVSDAKEVRKVIPAAYKTISQRKLVSEGYMDWRSILCETNMSRDRISQIQSALKKEGYNPGPVDGIIGKQTIVAMNEFQKANDLPVDRYLNIQTIKALGVSPN